MTNVGVQTSEDYMSRSLSAEFSEFNKNKTLIFQFFVKHEQKLDSGGGHMKLLNGELIKRRLAVKPHTSNPTYFKIRSQRYSYILISRTFLIIASLSIFYYIHVFQGYDDIPKEIPDPDLRR